MKPAVYLRVSTRKQELRSQQEIINRYLDGHDLIIPENRLYIDKGRSGAVMERPAFAELQTAIFMGEIDTVLMYSLDRFARTMIGGMAEIDKWQNLGVTVVCVANGLVIDPKEYGGEVFYKMLIACLLAMAEQERIMIHRRRWAGMEVKKKKQKRAIELHEKGWSNFRIAHEIKEPQSTVEDMIVAGDKLYWSAKGGRMAKKKRKPLVTDSWIRRYVKMGYTIREMASVRGCHFETMKIYVKRAGGITKLRKELGMVPRMPHLHRKKEKADELARRIGDVEENSRETGDGRE